LAMVIGLNARAFGWRLAATVLAREESPGQWRPWDESEAVGLRDWHKLALDPPIQQAVGRLLRHEPVQAQFFADPQRLDDLPRGEGRAADVANLSLPDEIVEGAERLVDGAVGVRPVNLVEIDVVGLQTLQR